DRRHRSNASAVTATLALKNPMPRPGMGSSDVIAAPLQLIVKLGDLRGSQGGGRSAGYASPGVHFTRSTVRRRRSASLAPGGTARGPGSARSHARLGSG